MEIDGQGLGDPEQVHYRSTQRVTYGVLRDYFRIHYHDEVNTMTERNSIVFVKAFFSISAARNGIR